MIHPYDKRYKTIYDHTRFLILISKYYSDTIFCKIKSIKNNTAAQVFTDGKGDSQFYPLKRKEKRLGDTPNISKYDQFDWY